MIDLDYGRKINAAASLFQLFSIKKKLRKNYFMTFIFNIFATVCLGWATLP